MPSGMTESAAARRIADQCSGACHQTMDDAIKLLKRANRYVGTHSSIGGQELGVEITEFIGAYERREEA